MFSLNLGKSLLPGRSTALGLGQPGEDQMSSPLPGVCKQGLAAGPASARSQAPVALPSLEL